jgi:hypothetical protein
VPYDWSRPQLIVFAWLRTLLVPLLLLCATPRGDPLIPGEGYPMLFSLLLGVTNGLVGSVPMIQAPSRVSEEHRELTGNHIVLSASFSKLMGTFYFLGVRGSIVGSGTMLQARRSRVSHRSSPGSSPGQVMYDCGGRSGTGVGFLRVLWLPLPIPTAPHSSSSIAQGW